jgi:hypothetical protein
MAQISFALYEAFQRGASLQNLSDRLSLPIDFIEERIEAARMCLLIFAEETEEEISSAASA